MSKRHEDIVNQIILDWSRTGRGRVFKNHQGQAWTGKVMQTNKKDTILIKYPQKITFGLEIGSSDLIGWEFIRPFQHPIIPVITSIEVKTKASPKITDEQIRWLNNIIRIGGQAYLAKEHQDSYILEPWRIKE